MYSCQNKENYFKSYYKRILRVLIPYWLIDISILIYFICSGQEFSLLNWAISLLTIQISPKVATFWFVWAIVVMYFAFYFSFNMISKNNVGKSLIFMVFCTVLYSVICISVLDLHGTYTGTIFSFIFGILWYYKYDAILQQIRKKYTAGITLSLSAFIILFGSAKFVDNVQVPCQKYLSFITNNLAAISFIALAMIILQKFELNGKLSLFFGYISYEIYLAHVAALGIITNENLISCINENAALVVFLLLTAIIIIPVYYISKIINKYLKKI